MREPTSLPAVRDAASDAVAAGLGQLATKGPSSLRRDLLLRLRLDGPELPGPARRTARRQPDRRPPATPSARGRPPRQPPDGPPRRRPAAPPVRRDRRRPGPLPVQLRRPGGRPAGRHRGGRRRRSPRPGLCREAVPARRPGPRADGRTGGPRGAALRAGPRAGRHPGRQGYLADATLEPDGTIRLREHNCAIYHVAAGSPAACQAELDLFTEILGAEVVREQHIASGDRCCSYRIAEH